MATDTESFNRDLYNLLKVRGYNPVPLDSKNQRVSASQDSDVIEFQFIKDGEDYGKVWITVDDAQNIVIYYDEEQQNSPSTRTPGVDYDDSWTGLLKFIKNWAQRRQMSFELANKDRLGDDMRQREYYKMKEKLGESWNPMGKTASYNDAVPSVKIIVKHNRSLEEGEARYRNIARIFLENQDGERFLAPTTRPGIARVYARHIAEGGVPNDERWNHIKSICEEYNKMAGFVRATRNKEFNESVQQLVQEGAAHYNNLRETLSKLTGHRGYQNYFESWTPTLMEGEGEDLSEMFMSQSLDPRIESAMPILSRLHKPVTEMSEVDSLAEWADSIISEKLEMDEDAAESLQSNNPQGIPEGEVVPFKKKDDGEDDWDDDSWIPSIEDFEQEERIRNRKRKPANDLDEMDSTTKSLAVPADEMLDEAPGAQTLAHNQATEKSNLKALGLAEMEKDLYQGQRRNPRHEGPEPEDKTGKTVTAKKFSKDAKGALNKAFRGELDEEESIGGKVAGMLGTVVKTGIGTVGDVAGDVVTQVAGQVLGEENLDEDEFAGNYKTGPAGQWRNKGPKANKPAKVGDLVGASESKEIDPELARIIEMARFKR